MGRQIVQIARTNCAGAIWRLHDVINKYTGHLCRTVTASNMTSGRRYPSDIIMSSYGEVAAAIANADVIHFQNWIDHDSAEMAAHRVSLMSKRRVLQYHTEPSLLQRAFRHDVVHRTDIPTLVIAQKHTRFYPNSIPVPNVLDLYDEILRPSDREFKTGDKLRVIYTPSDTKTYSYDTTCQGKGYAETMPILAELKLAGLIDLLVVTNMPWEELMPLKRTYDVCIDECVTGGYHLCSLEGLSQGLVTIAYLDHPTQQTIAKITGSNARLPWLNCHVKDLGAKLRHLASDPGLVANMKRESRAWMEVNWHPAKMVEHYLRAYRLENVPPVPVPPPTVGQKIMISFSHRNYVQREYQQPSLVLPPLRALEGAWKGQQVVIWGNGPTALEALAAKPWAPGARHIGTNAATLLPEKIPFDAYCIGDTRFLLMPEKKAIARTAPGIRVYQSHLRPHLGDNDINYVQTIGRDGFSSDLTKGIYHGYSVAYLALQLAVFTGATDILLAGCSHNYNVPQPRFYKEAKTQAPDNNLRFILNNYRHLLPLFSKLGISLRTIGVSRLQEVGVSQLGS